MDLIGSTFVDHDGIRVIDHLGNRRERVGLVVAIPYRRSSLPKVGRLWWHVLHPVFIKSSTRCQKGTCFRICRLYYLQLWILFHLVIGFNFPSAVCNGLSLVRAINVVINLPVWSFKLWFLPEVWNSIIFPCSWGIPVVHEISPSTHVCVYVYLSLCLSLPSSYQKVFFPLAGMYCGSFSIYFFPLPPCDPTMSWIILTEVLFFSLSILSSTIWVFRLELVKLQAIWTHLTGLFFFFYKVLL